VAYGEKQINVTVPAGQTTVTATFGPGARGRTWTVGQVSVQLASAPVGAACALYKSGFFVTALIPTGDSAGSGPPLVLSGTEKSTVTWTGVTAGTTASVFVIYDDGR
jgi:hypothetical protein